MACVRPFKGLRPVTEYVSKVASPPYDVIDSDEARILARGNPLSFLHVVKPEIDLDRSIDLYDERVYRKAKENFDRFISDKILVTDSDAYFYIYTLRMGAHRQTGLVACTSAEEYKTGVIKKHEYTRADKEADRTKHVNTLNANAGPVLLTYRSDDRIHRLIEGVVAESPEYDFVSYDGIQNTLHVVRDSGTIAAIEERFRDISALYIADGHHRSASAVRVMDLCRMENSAHRGDEEYNYFLSVLFPHDQLQILPYNRVVKDLYGLEVEEFLARIDETFEREITDSPEPSRPKQMGMFLEGRWHRFNSREGSYPADDPVGSLDVSILMNNVLSPVLGIGDPRTDSRINFVGGIRGTDELEHLVNSGRYRVAFALYPTSVEQLLAIADAGQVMPPKSTWFEPKLKSGLVVHLL
jgi:uncharacterized protein (DUF1015 family)